MNIDRSSEENLNFQTVLYMSIILKFYYNLLFYSILEISELKNDLCLIQDLWSIREKSRHTFTLLYIYFMIEDKWI